MRKILSIISFLLITAGHAQANECGYASKSELLAAGKAEVMKFRTLVDFDLLYGKERDEFRIQNLQRSIEQSQSLAASREATIQLTPTSSQLYEALDQLRTSKVLDSFRHNDLLQLGITNDKEKCDAPACAMSESASILVDLSQLDRLAGSMTATELREVFLGIFGHEIGHFILLQNITILDGFKDDFDYAQKMRIGQTAFHLLVDAIGMVLSDTSVKEFEAILMKTVKGLPEDQQGDIPMRLQCLRSLAQ